MVRRLIVALIAVAGAFGQNPPPSPSQPKPPGPEQPGGVFRTPSPFPPEPEVAPKPPEEPKKTLLANDGKPMTVAMTCGEEEISSFGMTCTELDPCPVYLELSGMQSLGAKILLAGNLHNGATTMFSVLLASEDNGKTWDEPVERTRSAGLDRIQFVDFETGWISGELLHAFPRDAFFLLTTDGGKSWRKRAVFGESRIGAIDQFYFDSRTAGTLVIDRMQSGDNGRFERHETMTGGDTWMVREVTGRRPRLRLTAEVSANPDWRLRADDRAKAYLVQRKVGERWQNVAAFAVRVGECRPAPVLLKEPPPVEEAAPAPPPVAPRPGRSRPPTLKKRP